METHLVLSDFHIPDHNRHLLPPLYKLIKDLNPDKIHILGDLVNFTKVSKYDPDPYYSVKLSDEIDEASRVLRKIVSLSDAEILWYSGNHENRLIKYLARNALALADLDIKGEKVVSIPHLFGLRELGVKWFSWDANHTEHGVLFEHGSIVRVKSGYTAQAMIDRRGMSGIVGHTHRLSLITRSQFGKSHFWIENGCLCNLNPTPRYSNMPDWTNGFSVINFVNGKAYPQIVPIFNNRFIYNGKTYS